MLDIGLVGCARRKLCQPAPARNLYTSPLFRLATQYCIAHYDCWFVLSAKHSLVDPDEVLAPYDVTLQGLDRTGRDEWAATVLAQLGERGLLNAGHRFYLHAGATYADPLMAHLDAEQPLQGLTIGRRLAWYRRCLG